MELPTLAIHETTNNYSPISPPKSNSITETEKQTLALFFKPNYLKSIISFVENSSKFNKLKLFKMIDYANGDYPHAEPLTSPRYDLAFNQKGSFGLSISFSNKRSSRRSNPNRFSSPGIVENGIFGYPSAKHQFNRAMPTKRMSHVHFIVDRIVQPEKSDDVLRICDDFASLFFDLEKAVDEKPQLRKASTQANFNPQTREVSLMRSPRRTQTLRLNDPQMKELYKSDTRWSPRITIPRAY